MRSSTGYDMGGASARCAACGAGLAARRAGAVARAGGAVAPTMARTRATFCPLLTFALRGVAHPIVWNWQASRSMARICPRARGGARARQARARRAAARREPDGRPAATRGRCTAARNGAGGPLVMPRRRARAVGRCLCINSKIIVCVYFFVDPSCWRTRGFTWPSPHPHGPRRRDGLYAGGAGGGP